jgi:TRAP-type mannitol/chloroaromatic compound transport system substrate-binding protein
LGVWNSLPSIDKAALEAATLQEFHASCAEARAHDAIARKTLASRFGVEFTPFPADVADAVKRVADATVAHVAGRDAAAKRIDTSYMAFKAMIADTPAPLV